MSLQAQELTLGLQDGLRIAAKAWGREDASVRVLALHGWLDNANSWDGLAQLLLRDAALDVRLVAMDFAGHGLSSHRSRDSDYNLASHVLSVVEVADALKWDEFVLCCHSMGAAVGLLVAGSVWWRVQKLIMCDGVGPWPPRFSAAKNLELAIRGRTKSLSRQRRTYRSKEEMVKRYLKNNPVMYPSSARHLLQRGVEEVELVDDGDDEDDNHNDNDDSDDTDHDSSPTITRGFRFRHDPRLVGWSMFRFDERSSLDFCRRIRCPVLVFMADNPVRRKSRQFKWMKPTWARRAANVMDIAVVTIEGSHHLHVDQPQTIAPTVSKFLRDPALLPERRVLDKLPPHPLPFKEMRRVVEGRPGEEQEADQAAQKPKQSKL